jgi:exodeoxyribonuclease V alpha subunit
MADEILKGQVEDFRVRKPDGWCVLTLFVTNGQVVDVTGVFPDTVTIGDTIEVCGRYTTNNYGTQFKASHMLSHLSGRKDVIEQWLAANLPNIGEVRAKALVDKFGADLWQVIEFSPTHLLEVPGITPERVRMLVDAYNRVRGQRDNVLCLTKAGLSIKDAASLLSELGHEAMAILESDPYTTLLRRRIQFEQADKVAQRLFKIAETDPRRIRAFAHQQLFEVTYREGHCYMMLFELVRACSSALKVKDDVVTSALVDYPSIVTHGKRCMLLEIDEAEQRIGSTVRRLLENVT